MAKIYVRTLRCTKYGLWSRQIKVTGQRKSQKKCPIKVTQTTTRAQLCLWVHPSLSIGTVLFFLLNKHFLFYYFCLCGNSFLQSQGEKERYIHLNAEFQRTARRDKAFLSDQCKEIEKNNRMGKTRDLFKKIRDTKGTFYAKMGSIKDRNGLDLTEAEDIKKS